MEPTLDDPMGQSEQVIEFSDGLLEAELCLTLMRPLLVKRQTALVSGFFEFFPLCVCRRSRQSVWCPDLISVFGCPLTWLHQTLIEVPSSLP